MKRLILLTFASFLTLFSYSQNRYVVRFTNKNNTPYSLSNPLQFLSQRALDRRANQNIGLDSTDLPVDPVYVQGVASIPGVTLHNVCKWFNAVIIETTSPAALTSISNLPYVQSTNHIGKLHSTGVTGKKPLTKFEREAAIPVATPSAQNSEAFKTTSFNYGNGSNQTTMIGLPSLHNAGYAGEGMIISLLDAGFLFADTMRCFDSLRTQNRIISTWDFVDHETNVYNDHNHGASVLSVMAANVPGDLVGTAPHARYILLRTEDANTEYPIEEYNWACGAAYADSAGTDIIQSSLGYTQFDDPSLDHTYADMDGNTNPSTIAADMASAKGILVVVSAGNEGGNPWNFISSPADADSALTIGAVDDFGNYAGFSSNGPTYDGRVKPDVAAVGQGTWLYSSWGNGFAQTSNGTSFSSPIIAGAAACLWQAWPQKNNIQIANAIRRSANQYSNPDTLLGYGIPNFSLANNLLGLGEYTIPTDALIHIFPNPWNGSGQIHILFFSDSSREVTLTLTDMAGKTVYQSKTTVVGGGYTDFHPSVKLSRGMYLVRFEDEDGVFVKKMVRE